MWTTRSEIAIPDRTRPVDPNIVNAFRRARGRRLAALITALHDRLGRDLHILDLGGKVTYWENVDLRHVVRISLQNLNAGDVERSRAAVGNTSLFDFEVGDATDLAAYPDGSVDLVHSNSVIEHVGNWGKMKRMAEEAQRVGRAGWIQTPAWEFPLEIHSKLPFVHWLGRPAQVVAMRLKPDLRRRGLDARRTFVDDMNMLTHGEVAALFPGANVLVERWLGLPKSYVASWAPKGVTVP